MENASSRKTFGIAALLIGAFILLVVGLEYLASEDQALQSASMSVLPSDTKTQGSSDAALSLLEYSDFQCPACASYAPILKKIGEDFPDKLRITYRFFPLRSTHPNAAISAQAAEAANLQGKFWEMHDQLFENQTQWSNEKNPKDMFRTYAERIGLDGARFEADMESDSVVNAVKSDESLGMQAKVPGTPSFFLDGKKIPNPQSYEEFKKVLEDALNK